MARAVVAMDHGQVALEGYLVRIEPDPCIPIVAAANGWAPDGVRHELLRSAPGELVGAQAVCKHDAIAVGMLAGRYVYPRADLRPDGLRILKGF